MSTGLATTVGKNAVEKGRPALKKSVELLRENEEEIREVHKILKETGAYEKMLEKALAKMENGGNAQQLIERFENREIEELKEFEAAIQEIEDIIQNEENIYEYAGRVINIIASVERAEESEQEDIEAHIQKFEQTRNAEHLEVAFKEEIDAIKTLHEEAELGTEVAEVIERATEQVLEIEELEQLESEEAAEQEKIFREEGELFMKAGEEDFLNKVKNIEQREEEQVKGEQKQTQKVVKLDKEDMQKLEEELARMLEEAKRNREDVKKIIELYEESSIDFQDNDRIPKRLQKAEQMAEQDVENIEGALKMLRN